MLSTTGDSPAEHGRARPRDYLALATLWLPFLVVLISAVLWWPELPEALPRQWNADGIASTSPTEVMLGVLGGLTLVAALGAALALPAGAAPNRRTIYLAAGFIAGLAGAIWLLSAGISVLPGADQSDPRGWPLLAVPFAGYGAIAYFLAHPSMMPVQDYTASYGGSGVDETADAARARLAASVFGRTEWTASTSSPLFTGLASVAAVGAIGIITLPALRDAVTSANVVVMAIIAFALVFIVMFARIRIRIDGRGLSVRSMILGAPLKIIPLTDIIEAHTDYLEPLRWGGWGYRITRGRSAVILRAGPGLVVTRRNGKLFAVSMTDPEIPAALLESLRQRR
ncbi:hypothetical protein D6T64_20780 [Cryobacterium melibiosiphilum]|uniref:DUF1648 domain-containing protein n=1 Tax=Cryobacterium melibiosiphilum TaxID=995039 RepID=A0A3A5MK32_9MICO|nr:hypothetical protein [Cryobacterium melibiosiphilum]RJT84602.1 hypothetical protein D6T64_20780 [Cryobacterium melibiosiphilum]